MIEQKQGRKQRRAAAGDRTITIPHFWGWISFVTIAVILALFTFVHPFVLPKSIVLIIASVFILWWLIGGMIFRFRFRKALRGRHRGGLRIGGWALDGWNTRRARHGSYWRAMRSWVR